MINFFTPHTSEVIMMLVQKKEIGKYLLYLYNNKF